MRLLILPLLLVVFIPFQAQTIPPVTYQPASIRDYFLGAWKLVSAEYTYPDGHSVPYPDLGANAAGFLVYTPSGHMCAQLTKMDRPRWADDNTPTAAEAASALDGFVSYCGTFELRLSEHIMVHHPETAWSPNWPGSVQVRPFHFVSQDRFFFRGTETEKRKDGKEMIVTWTITWQRLK